ncbi:MAG: hypothetical protein DSY80_10665 [Desulfocapsa sp.]|nr:MAG: hypothetical protein DSY80_10665 [Desulfocapsa sp.]
MREQTQTTTKLAEQEIQELFPELPLPVTPPISLQRFQKNSFIIEDSFYRSRLPRATHWSVAWSDLMMTMFILFLSMFVYQAAHKDFLVSNTPEVIGGSTMDAIDVDEFQDLIVPIVPLNHNAPLISSGTVLQVEKVTLDEAKVDEIFHERISTPPTTGKTTTVEKEVESEEQAVTTVTEPVPAPEELSAETSSEKDVLEPAPVTEVVPPVTENESTATFSEIYDISKQALDEHNLEKFASVEVIPDKTMRIILTGDLLFPLGQAELSPQAKQSLLRIAAVIKRTPYMINVIGHTDNSPMSSPLFASNWELSVVRASRVARFLIEKTKMNPQQFIVSGYGSHRPRKPNNNTTNRAANRRVEIVISKRLAPAVKANPENIL